MCITRINCANLLLYSTLYAQISREKRYLGEILTTITVDRFDVELLASLQQDGKATNSALGEKVHLSTSQVSRRIQRLEESGVISQFAAILDPDILGLGVIAFTSVTLERHGEARSEAFEKAVA